MNSPNKISLSSLHSSFNLQRCARNGRYVFFLFLSSNLRIRSLLGAYLFEIVSMFDKLLSPAASTDDFTIVILLKRCLCLCLYVYVPIDVMKRYLPNYLFNDANFNAGLLKYSEKWSFTKFYSCIFIIFFRFSYYFPHARTWNIRSSFSVITAQSMINVFHPTYSEQHSLESAPSSLSRPVDSKPRRTSYPKITSQFLVPLSNDPRH